MGRPDGAAHLLTPGHEWLPADWAAGGLTARWAELWRADPEARVVHDARRGWLRRGELDSLSARAAGVLHAVGARPGDRVLVSAAASVDLVIAHVGALRLGLVVVPAHTGYTRRELDHIVDDAEPVVAVLDDPRRLAGGPGPDARSPDGHVGGASGPVVLPPELDADPASDTSPREPLDLDAAAPDDPAMIMYTSGTTGRPKGAVLTHANLLAGAAAVVAAWRWTPVDRLVLCLPLFHMHGLGVGVHGTLTAGASAVIVERFDPGGVIDAAADHGATMLFGVPTMWSRLVEHARVGELSSLRLAVSGSAPLSAELHATIAERTGLEVLERYGMTETLMLTSNPYDGPRKPGTVGVALPGVSVRTAGDGERGEAEQGEGERGASEQGEIEVSGPNVFGGYWRQPDATEAAFTDDGWFCTGDVGRRDADGWWQIVGRTKELIITGGYNVFPREVEDVLCAHPAVAEAAVAGVPDERWGERVVALVVAAAGSSPIDLDDVSSHCAAHLVDHKRPRDLTVVDALPRNAMGKLVRPEVSALAAGGDEQHRAADAG